MEEVRGLAEKESQQYIRRLELTVKRQHKELEALREERVELRRKCREHFTNAQNLMRYQLKMPDTFDEAQATRVVHGTVAETAQSFELK